MKLVVEANSSSNTINAYAMYDKDKNFLNIFLLNKNKAEQEIDLNISNYLSNYEYQLWHFKGTGIDDKNPLWGKEGSFNKGSAGPTFVLPSNSVTMIQIKGAGKF